MFKTVELEALFTKKEMLNELKVDFFQNMRFVQKVSKLNLYLPRKKGTMNETLTSF